MNLLESLVLCVISARLFTRQRSKSLDVIHPQTLFYSSNSEDFRDSATGITAILTVVVSFATFLNRRHAENPEAKLISLR